VTAGGVARAVIEVEGAPATPPVKATLDQQRCRFVPHVQAVPLGSTLDIANGDAVLHNIHGWLGRMTRFSVPTPSKGARGTAKLDRAGVVAVRCDIHGWMSAWIVVSDAPAAVAGADGAFAIRGVPPGSYLVTAWHERLGEKSARVTVPAEGAARVEFTYGGRERS
jgi:plastocyanin